MQKDEVNLRSELITFYNLEEAVNLQNSIFPRENAKKNYLDAIKASIQSNNPLKFQDQYFIVKGVNDETIGIWGHYIMDRKDECCLGWFGIKKELRKKGYGIHVFKMHYNKV